jgi:lysyl-tRNA synthetase, class II
LEFEPLDQFHQRRKKLEEIERLGYSAYPHRFSWTHTAKQIHAEYGRSTADELSTKPVHVRVAGRVVALRPHGKAAFAHLLSDGSRLQAYIKLDEVGEKAFQLFKLLDLGDVIGVEGALFRTKTNELTVRVARVELLTKALLPLPEKWHGLVDVEMRYRRRYLDLITNERAREIFIRRAQIIREFRSFLDERGYIEVETPMMHPILGGATARPFVTHHNTFDMDLYLRIAPELYLKRLIAGGYDRVYEINRNFRNEGIDAIHQPEFTMLEFYQAYSDYNELMDLTEQMFRRIAQKACGGTKVKYGEQEIDFSRFERISMREAIVKFCPVEAGAKISDLQNKDSLRGLLARVKSATADEQKLLRSAGVQPWQAEEFLHKLRTRKATIDEIISNLEHESLGEVIGDLFEAVAEEQLFQPTFIYDFPTEISPLSKQRADDPSTTERFELFIAGMELANGFSELNDPSEQERRFRAQVEKGGQDVPKEVDVDYIRALTHGLPPTAGEGVGIDRLVMLLTDSHAIREVMLFPLLRRESEAAVESPSSVDQSAGASPVGGHPNEI